ncbi:lipopolysaccharide biosynthesis protein [Flavobacterium sp. ZT3R17]|uniref:lipopolysaccharide biosynthesis protein n=1 Tax=Flavobacterium cryoconiti TaxID=3398736 RepID=UPI003A8933CA
MSLKKNLLKNGFATLINKGIKIAEQLLLVPFFISAWGAAYYGEWLTLTIIPSIIGFSDLGFGTAAANSFILKYAGNEKQEAANISKSGFLSVNIIVVSAMLLSLLIIVILNYYNVFEKSLIHKEDAILAVIFLMFAKVLGFYQPLNEAYFRAARKASLSINLGGLNSGLNLVVGLIVLLCKGSVVIYAFSNLIIAVVFTIFYTIMARLILPIAKEFKGEVLQSDIKTIFHKGFGFLLSPVWQAIFFQGTTFVVRIVLGPVAVTIFNTVRTFTRAVNQANSMVIATVLPELQYEMGAGNFAKARKIFRFGLTIITIIAVTGVVFLYLGGPWFYELWTRKALNPPAMMWNIFIIGIVFNAIWWMSSDVLIAANKPYEFTIAGVIAALLAVLISYFLSISFGLTGAAIGSLFLDIFLFAYVFPRSCKLLEQPITSLIGDSITDCKVLLKNIKK